MNYNFNGRGSEWMKCDLHVHTPKSIIQDFGPDTDETWESYITDLENLPTDFKILGINDYLFLDGYEKVLEYKNAGRLANIDLILPVIEFRLDIFAGHKDLSKINFHIIFADESVLKLESIRRNFLSLLVVKKPITTTVKWEEAITTKDDLGRFGKMCKENTPISKVPDISDVKHGFNNVTHKLEDIEKLLNTHIFSPNGLRNYLTAIGRSEWENMRWASAGADKMSIINNVDFVFTGCETEVQHLRGINSLRQNGVNHKLLNFSDAHSFSSRSDIKTMRIGDTLTYCKCRPSFEGLRQLKYVFDLRVHVSEKTIEKKKPYYVIDKVLFADNTGLSLFPPEPIHFSSELNTIIGGKSTGKSLLLNHIAKSIDYNEVATRNSSVTKYDHESNEHFDFKVIWQDGEVDTLKGLSSTGRKIVYISQSYIDELTSTNFEERTKFNEFVRSIILQNNDAETIYNESINNVTSHLSTINSGVQRIFSIQKEIDAKVNDISEIGDEIGVTKFIAQIQNEMKALKDDGMSSEEAKVYGQLMEEVNKIRLHIKNCNDDKKRITDYYALTKTNISEIKREYDKTKNEILVDELKSNFTDSNKWLRQAIKSYNEDIALIGEKLKLILEEATTNLVNIDAKIEPLSNKSKQSTLLKEKMKTLADEQAKLLKIKSEKSILDSKKQQLDKILQEVTDTYQSIETEYVSLSNKLRLYSDVSDELEITIQVKFNDLEFNSEIENNRGNKPSLKRFFPEMINEEDSFEYVYRRESHTSNMRKFLRALLDGSVKTNQHGNPRQLAKAIFDDKYFLNFIIKYQNDTIDSMSPGKKNLVVLKLLIELNNSEYPILIDQPEDDLDNRSIYEDLVGFIKRKKSKRQIILVTHNPNVVVGTDSENTIVANQEGQARGRENRKYKFEYCNGAIEHSFYDKDANGILFKKGIKQHICDILEGGEKAFQEREIRYNFIKKK